MDMEEAENIIHDALTTTREEYRLKVRRVQYGYILNGESSLSSYTRSKIP